ncbi:type I DNA topoisomerase [Candidatus Hydrogenosomobacter endosymbioticus]|uniref:DNA topoisomerase 1 n=1 Tax=Candidatus Hydrogenosomobacter endosymbioticus TaxID=2558174 RepID=A0ABN6L7M6_9PROT|nr:type I DNA topoisomerase [Candidatus Hydrogenosomobacter endosymbioticus]BDB96120.1 DNA topoisomerase 1 [Candidatus Hydrogenosomobacter endosymbioticus]
MKLVVVESPAKARSLSQYLGSSYKVVASYGHVRDLVSKPGAVDTEHDFLLTWNIIEKAERPLKEIESLVKSAEELILATDLDREGEAISWHLLQLLRERKAIRNGVGVSRISFNSITKQAVLEAMNSPREIDNGLVEAYLARLSLDHLVGFNLSPILWKKLPGCRSAGRVQSVALRLVTDRENEILSFKPEEYWSIEGEFGVKREKDSDATLKARLVAFKGDKLEKFSIRDEETAEKIKAALLVDQFSITSISKKQTKSRPSAPFTTSSLQQEVSRKLGFSPSRTMFLAQRLYEGVDIGGEAVGLITYMRTDSVNVSPEAIAACRGYIENVFGPKYVPKKAHLYKSKLKNAQEAHEAIRPTDISRTPESIRGFVDNDQFRLYRLIWQRMVSSQMEDALYDQVTVSILSHTEEAEFRSTGSTLVFDGFLRVYMVSVDDSSDKDGNEDMKIPAGICEGSLASPIFIGASQHFTQPLPRYSEASLIKNLEELGIGRPSTYAGILQILYDRNYVRSDQKRLIPEDKGKAVSIFLKHFFARYVDYGFTAGMEEQLDEVSSGRKEWKEVLRDFWTDFEKAVSSSKEVPIAEVIGYIEQEMLPHVSSQALVCEKCGAKMGLRMGKFGPFLACTGYPECSNAKPLQGARAGGGESEGASSGGVVGKDEEDGQEIALKVGPYGPYFEWKNSLKRVSIPRIFGGRPKDLSMAMWLKSLPVLIGKHSLTGDPMFLGIGRFGPYIKYSGSFFSVGARYEVTNISPEDAEEIIEAGKKKAEKKAKSNGSGGPEEGKLGEISYVKRPGKRGAAGAAASSASRSGKKRVRRNAIGSSN